MNLAKKVEKFAICYEEATKIWRAYLGLPIDLEKIRNNSLYAMFLFATLVHERAGRNPDFPKFHIIALKRALSGMSFEDTLLYDSDYPERVWRIFKKLTDNKPNEKNTVGPVKNVLEALRNEGYTTNIILYLGRLSVKNARKFLTSIKGIGPKISALIMRDFHTFFGLWDKELREKPEKYYYNLQPIDRWVKRVSQIIWDSDVHFSNYHDKNAKEITKLCIENNVNPVNLIKVHGFWARTSKNYVGFTIST